MNYTHIKIEHLKEKQISILRFSRPASYNAMNKLMMDEIITAINAINSEAATRIGLIIGDGDNFMAGADIKEYSTQSSIEFLDFQRKGRLLYQLLEEAQIPWIALVDGYALGGGLEIALACDFIFSTERAKLGLPEVNLALVPGGGGTQRLIEKTGLNRTKEILLTGDKYNAQTFFDWGIINKIFSSNNLEEEAIKFCEKICRRSKNALQELKYLSNASVRSSNFSSMIRHEGDICHKLFQSDEAKEKIKKFSEK